MSYSRINIRLISIMFLMIAAVFNAVGQDMNADLLKVVSNYSSLPTLEMKIDVNVFQTTLAKSPALVKKYYIAKSASNYYFRTEDNEYFSNGKVLIMVDNNRNFLSYTSTHKSVNAESDPSKLVQSIDSNAKFISSKEFKMEGNLKKYTIFYKDCMYKTMVIYIEPTNMLIEKVLYVYDEKQFPEYNKVEINYANSLTIATSNSMKLSEAYFINRSGKNIAISVNYKSYQLIQQ